MSILVDLFTESQDSDIDKAELQALANTLQQRMATKTNLVTNLPVSASDQTAVFDGYLNEVDNAVKADERNAYRSKARKIWNKDLKAHVANYLVTEAKTQRGGATAVATMLAGLLEQIATDEATTLAQLIIDIQAV